MWHDFSRPNDPSRTGFSAMMSVLALLGLGYAGGQAFEEKPWFGLVAAIRGRRAVSIGIRW
jgi:hypothetical protein